MTSPLGGLLAHLRGMAIITPWAVALLLQDLLLSLLLLLRPFNPLLAYTISSPIAWSCWAGIQFIFERLNGAKIVVSGDSFPTGESAVVIANHVGWSDFYMIQHLAIKARMLGYCRYFAKAQLKKVPLLGWGLVAMGMPLVTRNWQQDKRELDRVFSGITRHRFPTWLISFSEATRFTPQKQHEMQEWCAANNRPQPRHLLYPRTKGFVATVQHVRRAAHVKAVYDLTIAYRHGRRFLAAPPFWDTIRLGGLSSGADGYRFEVHLRRFAMEDLPLEDAQLAKWLETRWVEKGVWLERKRVEWEAEDGGR
ncbi:acyltransferase [Diaporthe helianthi]|uniref:Acyltransferase n=1 Tax=Diaporthe helianthi TaxID=158607 RepID=A0A2P5HIG6_DIAHE|nr:acyltransferase [Diaporthe helianthi]